MEAQATAFGFHIGSKLKDKRVAKYARAVSSLLVDGEKIEAIFWANSIRPLMNAVVVTNARVMGVSDAHLRVHGVINGRDIESVEISESRWGNTKLKVVKQGGSEQSYGDVRADDAEDLRGYLGAIRETPGVVASAVAEQTRQVQAGEDAWQEVIIGRISGKALDEIRKSCQPGEVPEFVLASGMAGALAAFRDRCMIIKKGGMAGWMSGSFGGGRVATFMYSEITGIEYNSGWLSGVLEILTPSYQGSANKDYWRGTFRSRNANANDPWTLSNCLPLSKPDYEKARAQIDHLRRMVADVKRPAAISASASSTDLSGEIARLANLHSKGVLDEAEFAAAKKALIAKAGGS